MLVLRSAQAHPRRARPLWRRRLDGAARALSAWLRTALGRALAPSIPEPPEPTPPIPRAAALREGARLFEQAGEPIASRRVA
jgi:hypothetical protein